MGTADAAKWHLKFQDEMIQLLALNSRSLKQILIGDQILQDIKSLAIDFSISKVFSTQMNTSLYSIYISKSAIQINFLIQPKLFCMLLLLLLK